MEEPRVPEAKDTPEASAPPALVSPVLLVRLCGWTTGGHSRSISCTVTGSLVVIGAPGPATLCARTRKSSRAPVGRSFTNRDVRSVSPCWAATHSAPAHGNGMGSVRDSPALLLQP